MADSDVSSTADAQTELKKRARRRLVGAVALALTAVIVLPMVMDHEPRPPAQEIQIRIPVQDGSPFASRIAEPPTVGEPVGQTNKGERPSTEPTPPVHAAPTPAHKPPAAEASARPHEPPKMAAVAAITKPEDRLPSVTPEKPVTERSVGRTDEARAAALLAGGGGEGEWVIQLGAYRDAAKARILLAKLKEMGVPTYTEKIDSPHGPMTRVRAGPFASRDAAEKAHKRVKIVGVDGPIAQR